MILNLLIHGTTVNNQERKLYFKIVTVCQIHFHKGMLSRIRTLEILSNADYFVMWLLKQGVEEFELHADQLACLNFEKTERLAPHENY